MNYLEREVCFKMNYFIWYNDTTEIQYYKEVHLTLCTMYGFPMNCIICTKYFKENFKF